MLDQRGTGRSTPVDTLPGLTPREQADRIAHFRLPPVGRAIDEVYRATYVRVMERSRRFYGRYPEDRDRVRNIIARLESEEVRLPSGDRLSARRFRQLGGLLGMSDGAQALHYIVELPFGSPAFLHDVENAETFARNPIYAVLHEASWADGGATRWAAERLLQPSTTSIPSCSPASTSTRGCSTSSAD